MSSLLQRFVKQLKDILHTLFLHCHKKYFLSACHRTYKLHFPIFHVEKDENRTSSNAYQPSTSNIVVFASEKPQKLLLQVFLQIDVWL